MRPNHDLLRRLVGDYACCTDPEPGHARVEALTARRRFRRPWERRFCSRIKAL